jgi:AcrR family transcriptional regulator
MNSASAALPHPIPDEAATQTRGDLRRREILDAAFFVFGKFGYQRATLSDVARAVGVSPGTICHHFGTKNDLFEAVIADRFLRFQLEAEALLVSHKGSYRELLHSLISRFWDHLWEPGQLDFMLVSQVEAPQFPESGRLQFQQTCCRSRNMLTAILDAGIEAGEFRPMDVDCVTRTIAPAIIGIAANQHRFACYDSAPISRDQLRRTILEVIDRAVLPFAPPPNPSS